MTRRTITIDIDTGEWLDPKPTITGEEGQRIAAAVLPGMPPEEIGKAYGLWMSADPAPIPAVTQEQVEYVHSGRLALGRDTHPTESLHARVASQVLAYLGAPFEGRTLHQEAERRYWDDYGHKPTEPLWRDLLPEIKESYIFAVEKERQQ